MTSRVGSLLLLAVVACVACGSDPPKTEAPAAPPPDKTEVKMEAVPVASTMYPPVDPSASAAAPGAPATPPPADPSDDPNIGGPQEATVEKAVAPIRPRLRACYKKALATDPAMAGTVTFDTVIGKDGKVASARFVKKDGTLSDDLVNCLTSATKTMQFAGDRKTQVVAFSFGKTSPTPAKNPPPPTAPIASFGGPDAGPVRH